MIGDLDRQEAVERQGGCVVGVLLFALVIVLLAALVWDSVAVPIAASALVVGGVSLAMLDWTARG